MATNPKIRYDIEAAVSGGSDVGALANQLDGLAQTLEGDLKVQALSSAAALRELGEKQGAIENFRQLKGEAQDAAGRLREAQAAAQQLGQSIAASGEPTRAQAGQMAKLRDAVKDAKAELQGKTAALDRSRAALSAQGISTDNLAQSELKVRRAIADTRSEVAKIPAAQAAAQAAAEARAQAEAAAAAAAQAAAQQQIAAAKAVEQQQKAIADAVAARNNRAVEQARAAAAQREAIAAQTLAAERARAAQLEQIGLREKLSQEQLIARSNAIRAQYPRLAQAAQTASTQQVQANNKVKDGLQDLSDQLRTVQNIAVAALGGTFVGSLAKDVADTADQFANLQARVKLVTGEGEAFTTAWDGVQQIALRTNSELEGTADLFTRIAQAGKELGLSQQQALSLTETINQSIQLSGGSAASAQAAITQLVQGLQSGVVRGEEFNSIMEQSPRLARALADGLGVTTGKLRDLANQGALTTEVVLNAVQGQGATIAAEFDQLPPTVGRALQNLTTSWTLYVGEVDKATGASATAASAINALAQNLGTIADLLMDAGQAAAAFAALRLAQTFLGIGAAAGTATAAIAANTAAMGANTAASAAAAAGVGRFVAVLRTLRTFTLLGIVTNIKDIGTWIGEASAKLVGYKDRTEELARAEKLAADISRDNAQQKAAMAQAMQLAAEKARGLTPEAKALTSEFDKLREGGKGVADSLADIAKKGNLSDTTGIQAFSIALNDLGKQGKASGDQIREAFAAALKGEDLAAFEVRARAALAGTANEAEMLATVLDASLREAIRRSGADFAVISGGMGAAARSAINDTDLIINSLDRLKAQGVDTAAALTASIGKGIQTADSKAAIEALRQQVELVRKVLGDKIADGLLAQIEEQAKKAAGALTGLDDALKKLGITSDASLKKAAADTRALYEEVVKTGGSAREQEQAFKKMADAAIASGDSASMAFLKSQASARGLEVAVDATGKTIVRAMGEGEKATQAFSASVQKSAEEVRGLMGWLDRLEARNKQVKSSLVTDSEKFAVDGKGNRIVQQVENRTSTAARLMSMGVDEDRARLLASSLFTESGGYTPKSSGFAGDGDTLDAILARMVEREKATTPVARTVNVTLNTPSGPETVQTDEQGAAAMLRGLRSAGLVARG